MPLIHATLGEISDMFLLPSIRMSINYELPGPHEIDTDQLSGDDYFMLVEAIRNKVIISDTVLQHKAQAVKQQPLVVTSPAQQVQPSIPVSQDPMALLATRRAEKAKELESLMGQSIKYIQKYLKGNVSSSDLVTMLKIERDNKNRKVAIKFIEDAIEELNKKLESVILSEATDAELPAQYVVGSRVSEIEETEERSVLVDLSLLDS